MRVSSEGNDMQCYNEYKRNWLQNEKFDGLSSPWGLLERPYEREIAYLDFIDYKFSLLDVKRRNKGCLN